ncbi:MAG: hypothetical protein U0074_18065 [Kouleothrix sp.]|jgi:hypothetical protein
MPARTKSYLAPAVISADRDALVGLKTLDDYAPSNPEFSTAAIAASEAALREAEEAELRLMKALAAARDARDAAGVELHSRMLGAKAAVISQYGPSSDAVQALGLKKKDDYRRVVRRVPLT